MAACSSSRKGEEGVQWEWCGDALVWTPYSASTSALIEAAFQAGHPSVHFSSAHSNYSVHFQPLQPLQKNMATGRTRSIRRQASRDGKCVSWLWWEYESHTWHAYDEELSARIEAVWKENDLSKTAGKLKARAGLSLKIHGYSYNIEFEGDGVQYNLKTHFARGVRRNFSAPLESEVGVVSGAVDSSALQGIGHGPGPSSSNPLASSLSAHYENAGGPLYNSIDIMELASPPATEDCSICLSSLQEQEAVTLSKCKHLFHRVCIEFWFKTRPSCPECLTVYGTILGTQPPGEMHVQYITNQNAGGLAGYPGLDVIKITYKFSDGIQTDEHPNPGKRYSGTVRTAFLPKNREGEEVLELLKKGWTRRLLFRIGTSVTTGQNNVVTWASIHQKTRMNGGSSHHGYPDETYFLRVKKELEEVGVV